MAVDARVTTEAPTNGHVFHARCYWWPACTHMEAGTNMARVQERMEHHYERTHYPKLDQSRRPR